MEINSKGIVFLSLEKVVLLDRTIDLFACCSFYLDLCCLILLISLNVTPVNLSLIPAQIFSFQAFC